MGAGAPPWAPLCPQGPARWLLAEMFIGANLLTPVSCFPILYFLLSHPLMGSLL